jgi:hypothetical protein
MGIGRLVYVLCEHGARMRKEERKDCYCWSRVFVLPYIILVGLQIGRLTYVHREVKILEVHHRSLTE